MLKHIGQHEAHGVLFSGKRIKLFLIVLGWTVILYNSITVMVVGLHACSTLQRYLKGNKIIILKIIIIITIIIIIIFL